MDVTVFIKTQGIIIKLENRTDVRYNIGKNILLRIVIHMTGLMIIVMYTGTLFSTEHMFRKSERYKGNKDAGK